MEGFKWLLLCMVLLNSGYDDMMSVSGLDCFVCFYFRENNATKLACITSISNFTLPCNDLEDFKVASKIRQIQIAAEKPKFRPEFLNKRSGISVIAGNGDGVGSTKNFKYFCAVATTVLSAKDVIGKDVGGNVTVVSHGCFQVELDDAKPLIMDKCHVQRIDGDRSDIYLCNNETTGLTDGKPCNFDDKCRITRQRRPNVTNSGTPRKLMPIITYGEAYVLILIGIAIIADGLFWPVQRVLI